MESSGIFTNDSRLYLICDGETCAQKGISLQDFFTGALDGGVCYLQYRHKNTAAEIYEKNLEWMQPLCAETGVMLIVNDHAEIAEKFSLPLHLGQQDDLPENLTVPYGRSTHNMAELRVALNADPEPAYIAIGTMFPSTVKPRIVPEPRLIPQFLEISDLPLVLIGGITLENAEALPHTERIFYAVITDAFRYGATPDAIRQYVREWD